jgi:DNA-binding SARP family transcriptional activator/tetratricopeptide (TPR) repeat protein
VGAIPQEDYVPGETKYGLLGPLTVRRDGAEIPIPPGQQRVLLAALLLRAGQPARMDELGALLWADAQPASVRLSLQHCVMRLRRSLGADGAQVIVTEPGGYRIRLVPGELDITRFEAALATGREAARAGAWAEAAAALAAGLALWRGEPLSGVGSEDLADRELPRLGELRLQALEARIDADLHLGRHSDVIVELRQLTAAQPLRERLHALLMLALYRDGQQAGALAAYQAAREVLTAELGTEPGPDLRRLHQQVLAGDPGLAAAPTPPARPPEPEPPPAAVRFSLPPRPAAFTGRADEVERITGDGAAVRAISGMPGVGKTALAVHAAHRLRDRFPDRQLFIDLRGHTPGQEPVSAERALAGLLTATGADPRSLPADLAGRAGLWRDRMAGERALLVLDNAASSAQVAPLLPGGDGSLVLVTSRRQLADLPGPVVSVQVDTLPPEQAGEMFVGLAPRAAGDPGGAVAELAELAGFLPLAVSLLARVYNRHPAWALADLAAETRARLLSLTAERDSVEAALEVSWQQLDPGQQDFFRCLSLHPGTVTDPYAAAALGGVPLEAAVAHLDALHGEGLLTETGYRRYGMHDLVRRYAADRAAEGPPARRAAAAGRVLDYYQHTAGRAEALLARHERIGPAPVLAAPPAAAPDLPDGAAALAWARAERAGLAACLDYAARAGDGARVVALTAAMAALLQHDGPWPGAIARHEAAAAAAADLGDPLGRASALSQVGLLRRLTGEYPAAELVLGQALGSFRELGERRGEAAALAQLGAVRLSAGEYPAAAEALAQAVGIFRALGDRRGEAAALHDLGVARLIGDYASGTATLEAALAISREVGDRAGQASALYYLGDVRRATGDYPGAAVLLEEALAAYRSLDIRRGQANALDNLGAVRRFTGDFAGAAAVLGEALGMFRDLGSRAGQASALFHLGAVRRLTGDYTGATWVLREALSIARGIGNRTCQGNALFELGAVRRLTGDFPGAAQVLGEAVAVLREIGDRGAEAEALNETGALHLARGAPGPARDCHEQALELARAVGSPWDEAGALAGLARCDRADGRLAAAAAGLRAAELIFERIGAADAAGLAAELEALTRAG